MFTFIKKRWFIVRLVAGGAFGATLFACGNCSLPTGETLIKFGFAVLTGNASLDATKVRVRLVGGDGTLYSTSLVDRTSAEGTAVVAGPSNSNQKVVLEFLNAAGKTLSFSGQDINIACTLNPGIGDNGGTEEVAQSVGTLNSLQLLSPIPMTVNQEAPLFLTAVNSSGAVVAIAPEDMVLEQTSGTGLSLTESGGITASSAGTFRFKIKVGAVTSNEQTVQVQ